MNKNELIASVSEASGLSKSDAGKAVDGVIGAITGALKSGGDVRIVGFGTFSVAHRKATTGRNPRTGEPIQIKASKMPKFKPGTPLKEAVNLYGGTSISNNRDNELEALFACNVVKTKCPVSAASIEDSAVSGSLVSPIRMTSGSCRRKVLNRFANVCPFALFT